jgi:hypothetical protein
MGAFLIGLEPENVREKTSRRSLVVGGHDGVIERDVIGSSMIKPLDASRTLNRAFTKSAQPSRPRHASVHPMYGPFWRADR